MQNYEYENEDNPLDQAIDAEAQDIVISEEEAATGRNNQLLIEENQQSAQKKGHYKNKGEMMGYPQDHQLEENNWEQ